MFYASYCLVFTLLSALMALSQADSITTCQEVQTSYGKMGYNILDVPMTPMESLDAPLEICSAGFSCCTRDMERQLGEQSRQNLDRAVNSTTQLARNRLIHFTQQTHELIETIITDTESELPGATFGNSYSLEPKAFFDQIRKFMDGEEIKLGAVFDEAIEQLFISLVRFKNVVDPSNQTCIISWFHENKPFGDLINLRRTKHNFRNSVNAARAALQGLAIGRNVMLRVTEIEPLASCSKSYTRATFCNHCAGLPALSPCENLCLNVMKGCLAYHADLQSSWGRYTDVLIELVSELEENWNMGTIFDNLKWDLLSAIKQYVEGDTADTLRDQCGAASGTRRHNRQLISRTKRSSSNGKPMKTLMNKIRTDLRESKSIWLDLPYLVCANVTSQNSDPTQCWNGEAQGSYPHAVVGDGVTLNVMNPEVMINARRQDDAISSSIISLSKAYVTVENSKLGVQVNWIPLDIAIDADYLKDTPIIKELSPEDSLFPHYSPDTQYLQNWVDESEGSGSGWYNSDDEYPDGSGAYGYDPKISIIPLPDSKQGGNAWWSVRGDDAEYSGSGDDQDDPATNRDYVDYNKGVTSSVQSHINFGNPAVKSTTKTGPQPVPYRTTTKPAPRTTTGRDLAVRTENYRSAAHHAAPSVASLILVLFFIAL